MPIEEFTIGGYGIARYFYKIIEKIFYIFHQEDMMTEEPVSKDIIVKRLKRIEGQVRGIEKMIESGRECESIIIQLGAVRSAIESVGALVLNNFTTLCFPRETPPDRTDIESLARCIAVWGRVHMSDKT